jgi:hypothetical protein
MKKPRSSGGLAPFVASSPFERCTRSRSQGCKSRPAGTLGMRVKHADVDREHFQILTRDVECEAVARIDVRGAEEGGEARAIWGILRNERAEVRAGPGAQAAELGEVVGLGHVGGEYERAHISIPRSSTHPLSLGRKS